MALTELLFGVKTAKIGSIEIDADIETVHEAGWDVTEYPIESGANIADHRRRKLRTIRLTGIITNTPLKLLGGLDFSPSGTNFQNPLNAKSRAVDAWKQLQELGNSKEPIQVITSLETIPNMSIESLTATRTASTGNVLSFTATMKELQFANAELVAAIAPTKPKAPPVNKGKVAPPEVPAIERSAVKILFF